MRKRPVGELYLSFTISTKFCPVFRATYRDGTWLIILDLISQGQSCVALLDAGIFPLGGNLVGYRRYRRSSRSYGSRSSRDTDKSRVTRQYLGLDHLIRPMFLKLDQRALSELLHRYEREHGSRAREYAEKSYPSWKAGIQGMAATTIERLILLLPHVLSADDKYMLVKHLRDRTRKTPRQSFTIRYLNNIVAIRDQIKIYIGQDREFALPESLQGTLTWLANNDAKAAQALLRAVADREAKDSLRQLDADLLRLAHLIQNTPPNTSLTHVVDLPQVYATISAKGALPMSDPNDQKPQSEGGGGSLPAIRNAGDLLSQSFANLSTDDKNKLAVRANDEALRLRVKDLEAKLDGVNADSDINRLLSTTQKMSNQDGVDFDIKHSMKTESGQMNVHVEKKSPASKPIVWIILGVVALFALIILTRRH